MSTETDADVAALRAYVATLPTTTDAGDQSAALLYAAIELAVENGITRPADLEWLLNRVAAIWMNVVRKVELREARRRLS